MLLVNLGTPDAADAAAVRIYLKEFLTDPRVIENQGRLWKFVLNGIILPIRPRRKARDYAKIWNQEKNESPLKTITRSQAEKLGRTLELLGGHVVVDWAMRYGNPSIRVAARQARGAGLRAHPRHPALSAILRGDDRDRRRRGVPRARRHALSARAAHCAALLQRPRLYRGAGILDHRRRSRGSASSPT